MWKYCLLGLTIRLAFLLYGEWQDSSMEVKFTDVDYFVFDDAATFVRKGGSPYERSTYRYTPLLAFMLLPNYWLKSFGKILFIVFDVLTGAMIYQIFCLYGHRKNTASICASFWMFNPLPMMVSSRGNAESIMTFLVLLTLKLLHQKKVKASAVTYALSVHFKIYPVTYALPLYLLLGKDFVYQKPIESSQFTQLKDKNKNGFWKNIVDHVKDLMPNNDRLVFMLIGAIVLGGLTALFYVCYGWEFVYETYLYHIVRQDTRHNFSPYFYMLYLLGVSDTSRWVKVLSFLPQALLITTLGVKFYRDPPVCWFLITFTFVALNKVCTSQYFLWYLCLLPFLLPSVDVTVKQTAVIAFLWFLGQGTWLLPAYFLEFKGVNTFLLIWVAGLFFFIINMYILYMIIVHYQPITEDDVDKKTK